MSLISQPINKGKTETINVGNFLCRRPDVILLDDKQWLYIQSRYHMSPRELQIAKLVCQGLNNGDIANNLKVKPGTVKTHLRSIFGKTRARNKITMLLRFIDDVIISSIEYKSANIAPIT